LPGESAGAVFTLFFGAKSGQICGQKVLKSYENFVHVAERYARAKRQEPRICKLLRQFVKRREVQKVI
jgi:hypothetical protein